MNREELEQIIVEADAKVKEVTANAQQEDQRLQTEFAQAKAKFEQGVTQLNAVANNQIGQIEGRKAFAQEMLAKLDESAPKDDAGKPANEYPEEVILPPVTNLKPVSQPV